MSIGKYNTSDVACAPRQPIASDVAEFAQALANRAAALSERVNGKLHPVMTSDYPRPCEPECKEPEYPPLFSDLRNSFRGIAASLDSIEHALSRTEL